MTLDHHIARDAVRHVDPATVLQLLDSLEIGGAERVALDLFSGLTARGRGCCVGCLSKAGALADLVPPPRLWVGPGTAASSWLHLGTLLGLVRFARASRIAVVHSHNPKAHLYGSLLSAICRLPHVHTVHGKGRTEARGADRRAALRRVLTRLTDRVVAVSDEVRFKLAEVDRVPLLKLATIANGIDTQRYRPSASGEERVQLRLRLGLPVAGFVVGTVGRLAPEKNFPLLVRAFSAAAGSVAEASLVLVGEGPCRAEIQEAVRVSGREEACRLVGAQPNPEEWMRCFDLFVLPSDTEGLPLTLLEAMASEVPCVATAVGGNAAALHAPECGIVFAPGDEAALVRLIASMMAASDERAELGSRARVRAIELFSVDRMVEDYLELYAAVAGGPAA